MPTPNSGIPYVPENTIDPAAGLNESLRVIDALIQAAVIGYQEVTPPSTPNDGDRYIVGDGATGAWVGQDQNMAQYVAEGDFWQFYEAGQQIHLVLYAGSLYAYDGAWAAVSGGGGGSDRRNVTPLSISSGVVNINCALGDYFTLSLTANVTSITFSNLPGSGFGASLAIRIAQDATGGRTVALPSSFKAITGSDTSVQSAANSYTILHIETFDNGTRWEYSMKAGAP